MAPVGTGGTGPAPVQPLEDPVSSVRRAGLAVVVAAVVAAALRLRGSGGVPPQTGGWRELSGPDMR